MGLFAPAWKSKNAKKREKWVEKVNNKDQENQEILKELAANDESEEVRLSAIGKITDEKLLLEYYNLGTESIGIRTVAVRGIKNQDVLADIAKNDDYDFIRISAAEKVTDPEVLEEIANNDPDTFVSISAVKLIKNRSILESIASNHHNDLVRDAAEGRLLEL